MEIGFELGLPESSAAAFMLWDSLACKCLFAGNEEKCRSCRGFQKKTDGCTKSTSPPSRPTCDSWVGKIQAGARVAYSHLCHMQTQRTARMGEDLGGGVLLPHSVIQSMT